MEFDNSFDVPLPAGEAWKVLMDIRRIAPCMPGAELTEVMDERTFKGRIGVRLGPVALAFAGTVTFETIDEANHRARVAAQGSDTKGRGAANALVAFQVEPGAQGSKVLVHTSLTLSGAVAQYGRGVGIIQLTAAQIITQFANNLKAQLSAADTSVQAAAQSGEALPKAVVSPERAVSASTAAAAPSAASPAAAKPSPAGPPPVPAAAAPGTPVPAKPISGLTLMTQVLWQAIKRLFARG
jgi:uncharacterized protein